MTSFRPRTLVFGLILSIGTAALGVTARAQSSDAAQAQPTSGQEGVTMPESDQSVVSQTVVEPEAVAALKRMSAYLATLKTAEITSEGSLDVVTEEGQRVQLDGVTHYKLRRPGFVINYVSDVKSRSFIYDGKTFTVYSPQQGFYASVPAPPTNREVLDTIYNRFGIRLPLEDLFRWNDAGSARVEALKSGYQLGTATLAGVKTDHYVFREDDVDWEIWIQQGDQPLPRKVVIVDRTDPARPTFIARLQWKVNPPLTDSDFAFVPPKDAKKIELATFEGSGE